MTFSISSDETCAVSAVYENIKTHDGTPLRLPLRCNYLLAPKDGSVVKMTDLTVSSRPDASAHLQPAFLAIAPVYDGAIEFQTKTPGPVEVHLGYTVRNNFCLDAARFRKRWGLSANEEAIDDYKWVVTTDWKEITWEFHWPATFAATGPLWLMWLPPGASNDAPPGALPHKHFELTQEARKWVLRLKGVPVGAAIMPRWKLDEPPTKFA